MTPRESLTDAQRERLNALYLYLQIDLLPDDATLRTLDGPALARLALSLELAPPGTINTPEGLLAPDETEPGASLGENEPWQPWRWEEQAMAVVRVLQEAGVPTRDAWTGCMGAVAITVGRGAGVFESYTHESRPVALLRCAVRAQASRVRAEEGETPL
jgi:hypothetical protein